MSNNNNQRRQPNQYHHQQQTPLPEQQQYPHRRGNGVLGGNQYNGRRRNNNNYNSNYYPRRNYPYNQNYPSNRNYANHRSRWNDNRYYGGGGGRYRSHSPYYNTNRRRFYDQQYYHNRNYQQQRQNGNRYEERPHYNRHNSRYNNPRPRSRNRHRPTNSTFGDYVSPQLTTTNNTPVDALPQRQRFNNTQPFDINQNDQPQQSTTITTSAFRRRERREKRHNRQDQYRHNNNNPFDVLPTDDNNNNNPEYEIDEQDEQRQSISSKKNNLKKTKKKKSYFYLSYDQILKDLNEDKENDLFKLLHDNRTYGNTKDFILNCAPIYDELIRAKHELNLWTEYKKLNEDFNFWAKEIINRARGRNNFEFKRFVQKKINYFQSKIDKCQVMISTLQMDFSEFWTQVASRRKESRNQVRDVTPTYSRLSFDFDKMETTLMEYIRKHTKYVVKNCKARLEIAKAQKEEYLALKNFEAIAKKKSIWNIHLMLKQKLKNWSNTNKNFRIIQKRIAYNLLPKFIMKNNFSFKVDTRAFDKEDIPPIYDGMHQLTSTFQNQTMQYYYQIATREVNNYRDEIDIIIENCRPKLPLLDQNIIISEELSGQPTEEENNFTEDKKCYEAFVNYYKLSIKQYELQAEQSCYFLEEERIVGEIDNPIAPIPTLIPPPTTNMDS